MCLSILGTWRGESGEQWSAVQNAQSVMVSIQSLMDDMPYHNEPGFEKESLSGGKGRRSVTAEALEKTCAKYNLKITHETMRIAVCDVLDEVAPPPPPHHIFLRRKNNAPCSPCPPWRSRPRKEGGLSALALSASAHAASRGIQLLAVPCSGRNGEVTWLSHKTSLCAQSAPVPALSPSACQILFASSFLFRGALGRKLAPCSPNW